MEPGRMTREAPDGIEPSDGGFADLCLTTWLRRRRKQKLASHYGFGKGGNSGRSLEGFAGVSAEGPAATG